MSKPLLVILEHTCKQAIFVLPSIANMFVHSNSKSSSVLVGYSAINGPADFRGAVASYLTCDSSGSNSDATAIDIYGLND
jgi:1,3-beta-glucanosyltransferase GAS1